jgi:hypothetical protein
MPSVRPSKADHPIGDRCGARGRPRRITEGPPVSDFGKTAVSPSPSVRVTSAPTATGAVALEDLGGEDAKLTRDIATTGMDPSDCSAVLVTHAWSVPAALEDFTGLPVQVTGLPVQVVEDCSHAHGAVPVRLAAELTDLDLLP